jgi:hypothetical protein
VTGFTIQFDDKCYILVTRFGLHQAGNIMKKLPILWVILGLTFSIIAGFWLVTPQPVQAQCSTPSSCKTCHEVQGQKSVNFVGDWHIQHSFVDFCAECHGGNRRSMDKTVAHTGMATQLVPMSPNCVSCHDEDLDKKFKVYAVQLKVDSTGILEKARQLADQNTSGKAAFLPLDPLALPLPSGSKPKATPSVQVLPITPVSATDMTNTAATLVFFGMVCGGTSYIFWNEKRRKRQAIKAPGYLTWIWTQIRNPSWSAYSAGILMGFSAVLSVVAAHHLLSASGGIATVTSTSLHAAFPDAISKNVYFRFRIPPGLFTWEVLLLTGIFFGGMLSALTSGTFRLRWNEDKNWIKVFGPQKWTRLVLGFVGGMIIQYGASIAGGCTSGLAISGGMLLAPSAFLFMGGMFTSGILVALIIYRKRY